MNAPPPRAGPPHHAAVILAAGASMRLGRPKQLIEVDGEPLLRRAARAALATAPKRALIVVGAQADAVFAAAADLRVERVDCADWAEGMGASLRAAIAALAQDDAVHGALVLLTDQPALAAVHLQALVEAWRADPSRAVASAYADTIGVPALLPRTWFDALGALRGDAGARELLRGHRDRIRTIAAPALDLDLDHPGDLRADRENS